MVNQCIERSDEYKEYMLPENVENRKIKLKLVINEIFADKNCI